MKKLHITEAKAIAERIGADSVVVLAFKDNTVAGASYGKTRPQCVCAGQWMDGLINQMASGRVRAPILNTVPFFKVEIESGVKPSEPRPPIFPAECVFSAPCPHPAISQTLRRRSHDPRTVYVLCVGANCRMDNWARDQNI